MLAVRTVHPALLKWTFLRHSNHREPWQTITKRRCRDPSPSFDSKAAVAAIRGNKTPAEIAQRYDVHPNQIQDRKKRLMSEAEHVFENGNTHAGSGSEEEIEKLLAEVGELTMEKVFYPMRSV